MRPKVCASMMAARLILGLAVGLSAGLAAYGMTTMPAAAGCVAGIGCSRDRDLPSKLYDATCGELWLLRNSAYHDNGYCFRSARGRRAFSKSGCTFKRIEDVPLSRIERTNLQRIVEVEKRRGCK